MDVTLCVPYPELFQLNSWLHNTLMSPLITLSLKLFKITSVLHKYLPLLWFTMRGTPVLQRCGSIMIDSCLSPTQNVLSVINEKGPDTERIFRTLANKSSWTLKEKLDSGEEVTLWEESVSWFDICLTDLRKYIEKPISSELKGIYHLRMFVLR